MAISQHRLVHELKAKNKKLNQDNITLKRLINDLQPLNRSANITLKELKPEKKWWQFWK